jgi:hypothetical protein
MGAASPWIAIVDDNPAVPGALTRLLRACALKLRSGLPVFCSSSLLVFGG